MSESARFGPNAPQICSYVDILRSTGIEWGLLGPREGDRLWDRHILNSIAVADLIPLGSEVADVGSGAGLPGIPLVLLRGDLRMTLIEPLLRRANFLTMVIADLEMPDRVRVRRARAEEVDEQFDVITARAVAPLSRLLTWCLPLLRPGGQLLALKGRTVHAEVADAAAQLRRHRLIAEVLSLRTVPEAEPTTVVRVAPRECRSSPLA